MAARKHTATEATLPPIRPVPLAAWQDVRRRKWFLRVPPYAQHWRTWREIVNDCCVGGRDQPLNLRMQEPHYPFNGYLHWCEPVGRYLVVAWGFWSRTKAMLVVARSGTVLRCAEIAVPDDVGVGPRARDEDRWVYARLAAMKTAEAAVLVLRERQPRPGRRRAAEAWLRRQLDGLGSA
jgi:hypothetical protein